MNLMNNIAIIPARGGSKRIPKKNIKIFNGNPMIEYAIQAAQDSKLFKKIIVSSDDEVILKISSKKFKSLELHKRDSVLADDLTPTIPVIKNVIEWYEKKCEFENVCCIYPCVPMLTKDLLIKAYKLLEKNDDNYILPISEYTSSIHRALKLNYNSMLEPIFPENQSMRTQDINKSYYDAGQFYFGKKDLWKSEIPLHSRSKGIIVKSYDFVDIDDMSDWNFAEILYKIKNENRI